MIRVYPHYAYHTAFSAEMRLRAKNRLGATSLSGGGGTPVNGLYGLASPDRGTFFRLPLYKRGGISLADEYKRIGKSDIYLRSVKRPKRANS